MSEKSDSHPPLVRTADFRFYEELNDFLPLERRKRSFAYRFHGTPSILDAIQAIGVPHTAVDLILVDDEPVDFSHRLAGGERVAVYPAFERLDISGISPLRPRPLRQTRFVLDVHLGKLADYLRMLGFDCVYRRGLNDEEIIEISVREHRIILTRDRGILKHGRVTHGYWVRAHQPRRQVEEVLQALDLTRQINPFTRCMECNGTIQPVTGAEVRERVIPGILERFDAFWQCRACGKVYWQGSHYRRMLEMVEGLRHPPGGDG